MTACAAFCHDDDPPEAEPHAVLCGPCRRRLAYNLRRLPAMHNDLGQLSFATRAALGGNGDGLPYNDPAWECADQIRHDLTHWCRAITQIRGLDAPPPMTSDQWTSRPVAAMAGWLHGQVTWCTFRDWAPEIAAAMAENGARASTLLDPWVTKRIIVQGGAGLCVACLDRQPVLCEGCGEVFGGDAPYGAHFAYDAKGRPWCELPQVMKLARAPSGQWTGRMVATIYASEGDKRRPSVDCDACGQRWMAEQWLRLGHQVIQRGQAMAS